MSSRSMIKTIAFVLLLGSSSIALGQDVDKIKFGPLNPIPTPEIETVTLENGIRLYLLEDHSLPIFRVSLRVSGGSYLEPTDKIGLAAVCGEVMRTGGTSKWSGDELDEILEGIGGSVSSSVGLISSGGSVNLLSEYSELGLEVLADVIRNPIFDQDKIDLAKVQLRSSISRRNDNVGGIASREFAKLIYGTESPYTAQLEYITLDAVERDDLVEFHQMIFKPGNIQMAIWGDFDQKEVVAKIKELFGDWQAEALDLPAPPSVEYIPRTQVYLIDKPDAKQAYVRMGHLGGLVSDEDYSARIVMNSILGGSFGSRLTDNVRTRLGLAYTTYGRYGANNAYPGMFFAHASTGNQNVMKAAREMIVQIKSMVADLPTEVEMQKGKDGYLNSFVFNFDSKGEVINRLMGYDFWGLPRDFLQKTKGDIEQMTPEKVMAAAKAALHPYQMIVLIVGNVAEFDETAEFLGLGKPEFIDITIPAPAPEPEFTVDDESIKEGWALLDMIVAAHGGKTAIDKVVASKVSGTMTFITPQGELPVGFEEIAQFPYNVFASMNVMGRTFLNVTGPDGGWATGSDGELAEKTADALKTEKLERDRNLISIFKLNTESPYRPIYSGKDRLGEQSVEKLVLVDIDDSPLCFLVINSDNFQIMTKSYQGTTMLGEGLIEDMYANYQAVEGVLIPMASIKNLNGSKVAEIIFTDYEINPEIAAEAFDKPL